MKNMKENEFNAFIKNIENIIFHYSFEDFQKSCVNEKIDLKREKEYVELLSKKFENFSDFQFAVGFHKVIQNYIKHDVASGVYHYVRSAEHLFNKVSENREKNKEKTQEC